MKKLFLIPALIWFAVLLRLTVFRNNCFSHGLFSGRIVWAAFANYVHLVKVGRWRYFIRLFGGNLFFFAPTGFLVRVWSNPEDSTRGTPIKFWRWPLVQSVLWGFLVSLLVETGQYVLGSGVSELDDLILNTLGALLGYGFACLGIRLWSRMKSAAEASHK